MSLDPLVLFLQKDLLTDILKYSEDIGKCAAQLTVQIREIIGVQAVGLFERSMEGRHRLIGCCPDHKQSVLEDERTMLLVQEGSRLHEPALIEPGKGEMGKLLADLGMNESFIMPLRIGREPLGILLLLNLMDRHGTEKILDALKEISGVFSLVLRHSFLYRNIEALVEQRTHALRLSEQRARSIIETAMDGFWILDPKGAIIEVNDAYCAMTDYSRDELLSMTFEQLEAVKTPEEAAAQIYKAFEKKYHRFESVHRRKDGSLLFVEISSQALPGGNGELFAFIHDITERKRGEEAREKLQAQLNQVQKMESVGRLAGGVAHDFNNMLGVILGHAEMALTEVDPSQPIHADMKEIQKAAQRSANLTRQLLAFARKQTVSPKVIDLNDTVESMLKMLRRLIGEQIDLVWLPGGNPWPVKMDPSQIDQMLANLCVNARDAIAGVGRITIETGTSVFDETYGAEHAEFIPGEYAVLTVSDNGCGIDKETLANIFEPFFTTKGVGEGTGLGLATVYGAVKQNNGFINVYSEVGRGTSFKIYLPRHGSKAGMQPEGSEAATARGHETVLLVEDEPAILKMTTRMIERQGYTVLPASTPAEALRMGEVHPGEIHLLVTDVVMPEMNGRDLAREMLHLHPNIKTLFMSGYTADAIARQGVLDAGVNFIQKPFSIRDMAAKLREALGLPTKT